jgi:hypothetical protein
MTSELELSNATYLARRVPREPLPACTCGLRAHVDFAPRELTFVLIDLNL